MARKEDLLRILYNLRYDEFQSFRWHLSEVKQSAFQVHQLETANREDVVDLMVQKYKLTGAVEVTKNILIKLRRLDLSWMLDFDSGTAAEVSQKEQTWTSTHEDIYPVSKTSRANRVALLISNKDYDTFTREEAKRDKAHMEGLLTDLGYEVVKHNNLTGKEFDEALIEFSHHPKLTVTDSVFVVIMSLGHYGESSWILNQSAVKYLNSENCPALLNKPKIIIETCREVWPGSMTSYHVDQDETWMGQSHKEKDFISLVGHMSLIYRSRVVLCLVEVFTRYAHENHIEELFLKVMERVTSEDFPKRSLSAYASTLTKRFYLFPEDSSQKRDSDDELTDSKTHQEKSPSNFTPELETESAQVSYRFRCPGPGEFQCTLTGLVFVMTQKAELQYRTVQWDESLLQPAGKTPAGPLFNIKCNEDAVCQLHLPHCETKEGLLTKGLLSVVHITDDGMNILEPLEITDTHVLIKVPHLSAFGLAWALEVLARIWDNKKPIRGQVLLFLDPPYVETQKKNLNVFLLPWNVPLEEVGVQHEESKYIKTPSKCKLIKDQTYSVHCPTAIIIQPGKDDFDMNYGPNYSPMFQIRLSLETKEVTITVRDQTDAEVWNRVVDLTGPAGTQIVAAEQKLISVRTQFIIRVSEPVLRELLNILLDRGVITEEELEVTAATVTRTEKARVLIDMVRRKGAEASSALITALCAVDPFLSKELNLNPKPSGPGWTRSRSSWRDFCQLL